MIAGDDTEAYNFIMMDRAVKRIVGQTATKMITDQPKVYGYIHHYQPM